MVLSFAFSAILTTVASVAATALDHVSGSPRSLLPKRWRPRNISSAVKERCIFYRSILDRLILNLADQQLITGYALLICAWVKLNSNPVLEGFEKYTLPDWIHFPNAWLPNAQFSLVVFLCMASSSSHLACIFVLRDYMETHRSAARLRITLIVIFAAFLAVTVALASSLTAYFAFIIINPLGEMVNGRQPPWLTPFALSLSIALPLVVLVAISWLCTLQLLPKLKEKLQAKIRTVILSRLRRWFMLSKIWHSGLMKALPDHWREPCTRTFKRLFWLALLGSEFVVFCIQIMLAIISLIWIGLQRLTTPPEFHSIYDLGQPTALCSLHSVAQKNEWAAFGQLLPLILLLLPVLLAYGMYIEERDHQKKSMHSLLPVSCAPIHFPGRVLRLTLL